MFLEENDDVTKSILIIYSTPNTLVREVFLAMRVRFTYQHCSVTCLFFDGLHDDLVKVIKSIEDPAADIDWSNPLAFLILVMQDVGRSSEFIRRTMDDKIVTIESTTNSASWMKDFATSHRLPTTQIQQTEAPLKTMTTLHLCENVMTFLGRATDAEHNAWLQVRRLVSKEQCDWLFSDARAGSRLKAHMAAIAEFEVAYNQSKKLQIRDLEQRAKVQINLVNNMMTHQEASQTNLIAIVALVFAPASLTAGIFSAGLFEIGTSSWVVYVASTLSITLAALGAGMVFLPQQARIQRASKAVFAKLKLVGRRGRLKDMTSGDNV
ncbi:hypothetical protein CGGC5_v001635 [Colletotrichum fructicola Nara gc5]|uniref:Uncharacterized protein n=2 Tax=Colletotrichum fructicola (strain Nara gc5) TaxID=1213859 RepID=A0A7J6JKM4_COLFN|nr:hypothetical protein CGGC5_v001635 [Colletotrichum fructicola Nara gc5]